MIVLRNKSFSKKEKEDVEGNAGKMALVGAGLIGSQVLADQLLENDIKKNSMRFEDHEDLINKMIKDKNAKLDRSRKLYPHTAYLDRDLVTGKRLDIVNLGEYSTGPDSVAHELGHRHYQLNPKSGKIGRYAHKIGQHTDNLSGLSVIGLGISSGINKAKKEILEGKKETTAEKIVPHIVTGSLLVPTLIAEGAASRRGLKILKQSGASKEVINKARRDLLRNWGSYATEIPTSIGGQELIKTIAYKIKKEDLKRDLKKKEKYGDIKK